MSDLKNFREVGVFDLLSAPLNPIGAFDAEKFKLDARALIDAHPDDKFVAVDLMGLDFVYSDAYNAFLQFQHELSAKGGMLALLSNSSTILDGLKKAGLDRKLKVFAFEAELMSFSLHTQSPDESSLKESSPDEIQPVASQNVRSTMNSSSDESRNERKTGHQRRFTKSFNAITKDDKKLAKQGLSMPFDEEKSSGSTVLAIIGIIVAIGGLVAFLLMR